MVSDTALAFNCLSGMTRVVFNQLLVNHQSSTAFSSCVGWVSRALLITTVRFHEPRLRVTALGATLRDFDLLEDWLNTSGASPRAWEVSIDMSAVEAADPAFLLGLVWRLEALRPRVGGLHCFGVRREAPLHHEMVRYNLASEWCLEGAVGVPNLDPDATAHPLNPNQIMVERSDNPELATSVAGGLGASPPKSGGRAPCLPLLRALLSRLGLAESRHVSGVAMHT